MAAWSDRAEELLYDGESIEATLPVGTASIVVTTHRVLAFTPETDGANFHQVDRPNVTGVACRTTGRRSLLGRGVRAAIYGLLLLGAGLLLPIDSILSGVAMPQSTGQLGIGGVMSLFQTMLELLRNLDDMLQAFGALLLLFALVPMGVYLWSRERALVVEVAGDDDSIRVPVDGIDEETVSRLERAILPTGTRSETGEGLLDSLLS